MLYAAVPAAEAIEAGELMSRVIATAAAGNNNGISNMVAGNNRASLDGKDCDYDSIRSSHTEIQH